MDINKNPNTKSRLFPKIFTPKATKHQLARKISNKDLYEKTNELAWSIKMKKRRLSWLGHLLRLPEDTPARKALAEYQRPVKKPRGKPKMTWVSLVLQKLKQLDLTLISAIEKAKNRTAWSVIIEGAMSTDEQRFR